MLTSVRLQRVQRQRDFAVLLALLVGAFLAWRLGSAVVTPVQQLAEFSSGSRPETPAPAPMFNRTMNLGTSRKSQSRRS
jgi:hypothetical protein